MKGLTIATPPRSEWFPIGSIYISVNTTNPGTIFGGTWEQIKDKFMLCSGDTYSNGSMGGSASHYHGTQGHTLTIAEIPNHLHSLSFQGYGPDGGYTNVGAPGYMHFTYVGSTNGQGFGYTGHGYIQPTGGDGSHNHGNTTSTSTLPPYLAVTVWKRVA